MSLVTFNIEDVLGAPLPGAQITLDGTGYAVNEYAINIADGTYDYSIELTNHWTVVGEVVVAGDTTDNVVLIQPLTECVTTDNPLGVATSGGFVYVTTSVANSIDKIDIITNTVVATITVGTTPRGITIDGGYAYVSNSGSDDVSKIDLATDTVVATIPVGTEPWEIAIDGGYAYVTNYGGHDVSKIDLATDTVVATISTTWGSPQAIAISGGYAYVASFSLDIKKIDLATNTVTDIVSAVSGQKSIVIDGGYAYVSNSGSDDVSKIDLATDTVVATIPVGTSPLDIAISGGYAYVTNSSSNDISKIDLATDTVVAILNTGYATSPWDIAIDGGYAYVSSNYYNNVCRYRLGDPVDVITFDILNTYDSTYITDAAITFFGMTNTPGDYSFLGTFTAGTYPVLIEFAAGSFCTDTTIATLIIDGSGNYTLEVDCPPPDTVTFDILNTFDSTFIIDASITLDGVTNINGDYEFNGSYPAGTYPITVNFAAGSNCDNFTTTITLPGGDHHYIIEVHCEPSMFGWAFLIVDQYGNVINNAQLTLTNLHTGVVITNPRGDYTFMNTHGTTNFGSYPTRHLDVDHPYCSAGGYGNYNWSSGNLTVQVTLQCVPPPELHPIEFFVTTGGNPLPGATITIDGITYPAGAYYLYGFANGTYPYSVARANCTPVSGTLTVADGPTVVNVELDCGDIEGCCVVFNLIDAATNNPVTDAIITFGGYTNPIGDYDFGCNRPCCSFDPWTQYTYHITYPNHPEMYDVYRKIYLCNEPGDTIDVIVPGYIEPDPEPTDPECMPRYHTPEALTEKANCICKQYEVAYMPICSLACHTPPSDDEPMGWLIVDVCGPNPTDFPTGNPIAWVYDPDQLLPTLECLCSFISS